MHSPLLSGRHVLSLAPESTSSSMSEVVPAAGFFMVIALHSSWGVSCYVLIFLCVCRRLQASLLIKHKWWADQAEIFRGHLILLLGPKLYECASV